jgi:hypothetical protein
MPNANEKTPVTYRLTPEALKLVEKLQIRLGLSKQGIVETAIRLLSEKYPTAAARGK